MLTALGLVLAGTAGLYWGVPQLSRSAGGDGPALYQVQRGEFLHDLTERGELESSSNVEIRCEVKAMNTSGTTLLEILPEGTVVEAGDVLAKLDSSALENDRLREQILVATSEADVIKARTTLETATMARDEYLKGTFAQNCQMAEADVFVAEENVRKAEEYLKYSQKLHSKGYITKAQLEADTFAAKKARKDLDTAETKLNVLRGYTHKKMLMQLEAEVKSAESRLKAMEHSNELELSKLAEIESQLAKCTIRAPSNGQIVYANVVSSYGPNYIIEPGCMLRERQEIIRLPDHTKMQVRARINEAKVPRIAKGMSATVRLDAFPDQDLRAEVERINEYPAPANRYASSAKEYETFVRIIDPPPGARPGLTAEVKIHVEYLPDVVQVPVQAVIEQGEERFCVVPDGDGFEPRKVSLGSSNDKFVVVREGVTEGDEVVLNAGALRTRLSLPDLPSVEKRSAVAQQRPVHKRSSRSGKHAPPGEKTPPKAVAAEPRQVSMEASGRASGAAQ